MGHIDYRIRGLRINKEIREAETQLEKHRGTVRIECKRELYRAGRIWDKFYRNLKRKSPFSRSFRSRNELDVIFFFFFNTNVSDRIYASIFAWRRKSWRIILNYDEYCCTRTRNQETKRCNFKNKTIQRFRILQQSISNIYS